MIDRRSIARALAIAACGWLITACSGDEGGQIAPMPWDIERVDSGSTRVLGIELRSDTLADATRALGDRYELALFGERDQVPALEAYYKEITLGGLSARVVLNLDLPEADLEQMRRNSPEDRVLAQGQQRRWIVAEEDRERAREARVAAVTYIPMVQIDEDTARRRFGEPDEIVPAADGGQHWLYPDLGLDLTLDPDGRDLLQYVPPAEFDRLRTPLDQ